MINFIVRKDNFTSKNTALAFFGIREANGILVAFKCR